MQIHRKIQTNLKDAAFLLLLRNSYYRTSYSPKLNLMNKFHSVYVVKSAQKVDYGTIESLIVKISQGYLRIPPQSPDNFKNQCLQGILAVLALLNQ